MNVEDNIILLEVQIQNITPHPMYLEVVSFDPAPGFKATNYNIVQQNSEGGQEDDQEEGYDSLMAHVHILGWHTGFTCTMYFLWGKELLQIQTHCFVYACTMKTCGLLRIFAYDIRGYSHIYM